MTLVWIAVVVLGVLVVSFAFVAVRDSAARRSGLLPPAGRATMADVERLVRAGERIAAIRCYREIHHVGLAQAKKAIDELSIAS
jgi:ribosomal protein L7/L12